MLYNICISDVADVRQMARTSTATIVYVRIFGRANDEYIRSIGAIPSTGDAFGIHVCSVWTINSSDKTEI